MGIPGYFHWISNTYPTAIERSIEGKQVSDLYIDFNVIIHNVAYMTLYSEYLLSLEDLDRADHSFDADIDSKIITEIEKYIDALIERVKPTQYVLIATDGVPSRAKIQSQRYRRHLNVKSAMRSIILSKWDSNKITPGTQFMDDLCSSMRPFLKRLRKKYKPLKIKYSSHNEVDEGELKIIRGIRYKNHTLTADPSIKRIPKTMTKIRDEQQQKESSDIPMRSSSNRFDILLGINEDGDEDVDSELKSEFDKSMKSSFDNPITVIYSNDNDIINYVLVLNTPNIYIMREYFPEIIELKTDESRVIDQQHRRDRKKYHEEVEQVNLWSFQTEDTSDVTPSIDDTSDREDDQIFISSELEKTLMDAPVSQYPGQIIIPINGKNYNVEIQYLDIDSFGSFIETCIENDSLCRREKHLDFVFMLYFIGNDYIPQLPSVFVYDKGIRHLIKVYNEMNHGVALVNYHPDPTSQSIRPSINYHLLHRIFGFLGRNEYRYLKDLKERSKGQTSKNIIDVGNRDWVCKYYESFGRKTPINLICTKYIESLNWSLCLTATGFNPSWSWYYTFRHAPLLSDLALYLQNTIQECNLAQIEFNHKQFLRFRSEPIHMNRFLPFVLPIQSINLIENTHTQEFLRDKSPHLYPTEFEVDKTNKFHEWQYIPIIPNITDHDVHAHFKSIDCKEESEESIDQPDKSDLIYKTPKDESDQSWTTVKGRRKYIPPVVSYHQRQSRGQWQSYNKLSKSYK
jgi:5'-3' exonuclease